MGLYDFKKVAKELEAKVVERAKNLPALKQNNAKKLMAEFVENYAPQIQNCLDETLKNPWSFVPSKFRPFAFKTATNKEYAIFFLTYRAKNSYGAYEISQGMFIFRRWDKTMAAYDVEMKE